MNIRQITCLSLFTASLVACAEPPPPASPPPPPVPEAPAPPPPAPEPPPPAPVAEAPKYQYKHLTITEDHIELDQRIHFGNNSAEIQEDSNELLDEIAMALKEHGEIATLHVVGHTDSKGDAAQNKDLSERRAKAVVAALKERGVEQAVDARGAGEDELTCTENTPECHEKNRRVELKFEKK